MSIHTLRGDAHSPSPQESLLNALVSSSSAFDMRSIQIIKSEKTILTTLIRLPGEMRWRAISTPDISPEQAIFLAHAIIDHHSHHYPHRKDILSRWSVMIDDASTPYKGISLIMGMS